MLAPPPQDCLAMGQGRLACLVYQVATPCLFCLGGGQDLSFHRENRTKMFHQFEATLVLAVAQIVLVCVEYSVPQFFQREPAIAVSLSIPCGPKYAPILGHALVVSVQLAQDLGLAEIRR